MVLEPPATPLGSGTACGCVCTPSSGGEGTQHFHRLALPCGPSHTGPPVVTCPVQARLTIQLYCEVTNRLECP